MGSVRGPDVITADEYKLLVSGQGRIKAKPTMVDGIRFPSLTQARVYQRVKLDLLEGWKLCLDMRFPLISVMPVCGRPKKGEGYITIDFTIWQPCHFGWELVRAIDAKPKSRHARSRDWARGAAAFKATYGIEIEEMS